MTYRAVPRHLPLRMASNTKAHPIHVVHPEDLRHPLHFAMAGAAGVGPERFDVPLVRKVCVAGQVMDADPLDGLLLGPGLAHLLDLRLVRAVPAPDHQMAAHARLERGNPRFRRNRDGVVAVLALDLVLPGMNVVTKEDRLAGAVQTSCIAGGESRCEGRIGFGRSLLGAGTGTAEREESSQASGCNATDDESQLTHHHLTAEEDLGPASGKCAPKYSAAISLHNPMAT